MSESNNSFKEIERKFLIDSNSWDLVLKSSIKSSEHISQAYLSTVSEQSMEVRVRVITSQSGVESSVITVKSGGLIERSEVETQIDNVSAKAMLAMAISQLIEKTRYKVDYNGNEFHVDVFHGALTGLITAEVELSSQDQEFDKPEWLGQEITFNKAYKNASLAKNGLPDIKLGTANKPF